MLLRIDHRLEYRFDDPARFSIHYVRLWPTAEAGQTTVNWEVDTPGRASAFTDGYGNRVLSVSITEPHDSFFVHARGIIETKDKVGVFGFALDPLPAAYWLGNGGLAAFDEAILAFVESVRSKGRFEPLTLAHALMGEIYGGFGKTEDRGDPVKTARAVLDAREGTAQDITHLFIAAARAAGLPARFASGYLHLPDLGRTALHHWAEVNIPALGWVGFDAVHGISPTDSYVRLAVGRDETEAAPVVGLRAPRSALKATVSITTLSAPPKKERDQQQAQQ